MTSARLRIAWSFISWAGTTVIDAGTSFSGVSVLVKVDERVGRYSESASGAECPVTVTGDSVSCAAAAPLSREANAASTRRVERWAGGKGTSRLLDGCFNYK